NYICRYAVVTGGNKGIGYEICKQLASNGILVVLTARDRDRGLQAVQQLIEHDSSLADNIVFQQLDVTNTSSISSLASFIKTQFGKLDILVNNAGILGADWREDVLKAVTYNEVIQKINWNEVTINKYELAEECLKTNYYGPNQMVETFLPLLQLSDSPRIVNVSSMAGTLKVVKNEWAIGVLGDADNLAEETVEVVLKRFMEDFKEGLLETKGWPSFSPTYCVSKACLNAYTRIIAKKYPNFCINCVCPGFVKTDINLQVGPKTTEEGAKGPVMLALLPDGSPSGRFFDQTVEASF
ncbi:(+)-neomenthol dehydrogenase, partial [Linum perenne]